MAKKRHKSAALQTRHIHRKCQQGFIVAIGEHSTEGIQRTCRSTGIALNGHASLISEQVAMVSMAAEHVHLEIQRTEKADRRPQPGLAVLMTQEGFIGSHPTAGAPGKDHSTKRTDHAATTPEALPIGAALIFGSNCNLLALAQMMQ